MKISVIIPHVSSPKWDAMLKRCVQSLKGCDELIVVVNDFIGFAKAVNKGLSIATGDYLFIVNNDTEMLDGDLHSMCFEEALGSALVNGVRELTPGCFFSMSRNTFETIGFLDERFELGMYEDEDYFRRCKEKNIPIILEDEVKIKHKRAMTMKTLDCKEIDKVNKAKFIEKWGSV